MLLVEKKKRVYRPPAAWNLSFVRSSSTFSTVPSVLVSPRCIHLGSMALVASFIASSIILPTSNNPKC